MTHPSRKAAAASCALFLLAGVALSLPSHAQRTSAHAPASRSVTTPYDPGTPNYVDLYLHSTKGNDVSSGTSRDLPLRTLAQAWINILKYYHSNGVRINLEPGVYIFDRKALNRYILREASRDRPILIRAINGPGTVTISGGLEFEGVSYLYLQDLTLSVLSPTASIGRNAFRAIGCDHLWLRNVQLNWDVAAPPGTPVGGLLEAVRSEHLYIEECDFGAGPDVGADLFSVQYGHFLKNRFRGPASYAVRARGGSAYWRLEQNDISECGAGILAGGTSNLAEMRNPWITYECYDLKAVNNLLRDLPGPGFTSAGAYCAQFAHNTLFRVGTYRDASERGEPLFRFTHGGRTCGPTSLPGTPESICAGRLAEGGWGPSTMGPTEPIPSFHVYVCNNVVLNPAPYQTRNTHFEFLPARAPGAGTGIPVPSYADLDVVMRSNVIWNGPPAHPLGAGGGQGCGGGHTHCNPERLVAENHINRFVPSLIAPTQGDFRPRPRGNLFDVALVPMPPFSWTEMPSVPAVPIGNLDTSVTCDYLGAVRDLKFMPGAFSGIQPPPFAVSGSVTDQYFVPLPGAQVAFLLVKGRDPAPPPVFTDENGVWRQEGFAAEGIYRAVVTKAGYTFAPPILDFDGPREELTFTGDVDGYSVFGFVMDQHDHAIPGATITFVGLNVQGRPTPEGVRSDATGFFTQAGFKRRGRYRVTAGKANYRFTPRTITFARPGKALVFRGKRFR